MSVFSMTAFARETAATPVALVVELRSVNHRYLDCHFKLPDSLRALEPRLRDALTKQLKRGKVDCFIRQGAAAGNAQFEIDRERVSALVNALESLDTGSLQLAAPDALALLQFPGVLREESESEANLNNAAFALFEQALGSLAESRAREGRQLAAFLQQRLNSVAGVVKRVRASLPELRERQQERLRRRLEEIEQPVDEGRLEQELVMLLMRADVDEELDRLNAHLEELSRILSAGGPCGRRLDFLMQELNREANTLSSKSTASSTTESAVELKVLIEQMREQIQNIE